MQILLLVSAFNGLSQRTWCVLREAGHDVGVLLASTESEIIDGVRAAAPDLIVCPYLKDHVPAEVWLQWRTVIVHLGPVGDRGPSSLDWTISEGAPRWGVTALQAVEEMDAGRLARCGAGRVQRLPAGRGTRRGWHGRRRRGRPPRRCGRVPGVVPVRPRNQLSRIPVCGAHKRVGPPWPGVAQVGGRWGGCWESGAGAPGAGAACG